MCLDYNIIRDSFKGVHGCLPDWADTFFDLLFERYPGFKPFFVHSDMGNVKQNFVSTVAMIIDHIQHDELLGDAVKHLALRHMHYGALEDHYPLFGEVLIDSIREVSDVHWGPETQEAWELAFGKIQGIVNRAVGEYRGLLSAG